MLGTNDLLEGLSSEMTATRMEQFLTDMGLRISKRRKELKLTQEQVAEKMEVSLQTISCIELGKKAIRPENLANLCAVLDITADYILVGKKNENQLVGIIKKLALLPDDDMIMIEQLTDHFLKK